MNKVIGAAVCAALFAGCSSSASSSSSSGGSSSATSSTGSSGASSSTTTTTTSSTASSSTGSTGAGSTGSGSSSGSGGSTGGNPDAGTYAIGGLSANTDVTYDAEGVPHIHAGNLLDAITVQGYLHAQDRLFEMDLFRHVAEGRLCEYLGTFAASQDEYFLTIFTTPHGNRIEDELVAAQDVNTLAVLQAYANGVNAYIAQAQAGQMPLSGEFAALAVTADMIPQWQPKDSLAIGRLQQWELSETLDQDLAYGDLVSNLSDDETTALVRAAPIAPAFTTVSPSDSTPQAIGPRPAPPAVPAGRRAQIRAYDTAIHALQQQHDQLRRYFGRTQLTGSNNWVVDAAHSANGHAMVANDPHLTLNYPPLFHMSHLITDDGVDVLGNTFPGVPGMLTGRGAHVGWGVTVVGYDVTDVYMETLVADGGYTQFNGQPTQIMNYPQVLHERDFGGGSNDVTYNVQIVPQHGPIVQGVDATHALSMRWTGHEPTQEIKALVHLIQATSVDDAFAALTDWGTGAQNFVLADDDGGIGYDPHAHVPIRPWAATNPPWLPLPGDGSCEWGYGDGGAIYLPDDELPQAKNPAWGYLVTANTDPVGVTADDDPTNDGNYLSFDFDDSTGLREQRIRERLAVHAFDGGVSEGDMESIQGDHAVILGRYFLPYIDTAFGAATAEANDGGVGDMVALLDQWGADGYACPTGLTGIAMDGGADPDATNARDSAACWAFHEFLRYALQDAFGDEASARNVSIPADLELKSFLFMLDPSTPANLTTLCDDVSTPGTVETCNDIVIRALHEARTTIQSQAGTDVNGWRWGKVHGAQFVELLPSNLTPSFNAGPFARPGGAFSVDVATPSDFTPGGSMVYEHGPNERFVAVMDGSVTRMQLPGYQHDGPFVGPTGLLGDWLTNTYFDYPRTSSDITAAAVNVVTFQPSP